MRDAPLLVDHLAADDREHFAAVCGLLRAVEVDFELDPTLVRGIDYYTRWDHAQGKGHGTEPHLGTGTYASMNAVLMIAFPDDAALEGLIGRIIEANRKIVRPDDHIRLFQLPLDRIV
jgi:hypothetical protein